MPPLLPTNELICRCAFEVAEALIWTDLAGTMVWVNRRAQELFGYAGEEMVGKPMAMLYGAANSAELAKEIADATLAGNWRGDIVNVTKAGLEFPCQMTSTLIRDDSGAPIGIAGVLVDLRRLWVSDPEADLEAAGARSLIAIIAGARGDEAARAVAEGAGMETVALFDEKGGITGFFGDPLLREVLGRHPFPQTEGAISVEVGAKGALQGSVKSGGGVIALSVDRKEVTEVGRAFFKAMLRVLRISP